MSRPLTTMTADQQNSVMLLGGGQLAKRLHCVMPHARSMRQLAGKRIDITSEDFIPVLSKWQPKVLINAAAYTHVDKAELDFKRAFEVNSLAVERMARYCHGNGIAFITFSTDYVFDDTHEIYSEDCETSPLNNYGRTKLDGEKRVLALDMQVPHYVIRTATLYDSPDYSRNNLPFRLINKLLCSLVFNVYDDVYVTPTNALDLAIAVRNLVVRILHDQKRPDDGILHMASKGNLSVLRLASELRRLYGATGYHVADTVPRQSENVPETVTRPTSVSLVSNKSGAFPDSSLPSCLSALYSSFLRDNWYLQVDDETKEILTGDSAVQARIGRIWG